MPPLTGKNTFFPKNFLTKVARCFYNQKMNFVSLCLEGRHEDSTFFIFGLCRISRFRCLFLCRFCIKVCSSIPFCLRLRHSQPRENPLNLGDIVQGCSRGSFELRNLLDVPVRIIQVNKSCRCTEITVSDNDVPPKGSAKLDFEWDTTGGRGVRGSGFTVLYTVAGRDGVFQTSLSVKGNILPFFDVEPKSPEFDKEVSETKTVRLLQRRGDVPVQIKNVFTSSPSLKVEKISAQEVSVTFLPEKFEDDPHGTPYFTIETDCETEKTHTIFPQIRSVNQPSH